METIQGKCQVFINHTDEEKSLKKCSSTAHPHFKSVLQEIKSNVGTGLAELGLIRGEADNKTMCMAKNRTILQAIHTKTGHNFKKKKNK